MVNNIMASSFGVSLTYMHVEYWAALVRYYSLPFLGCLLFCSFVKIKNKHILYWLFWDLYKLWAIVYSSYM